MQNRHSTGETRFAQLNSELATKARFFKAPPFTPELCKAIKLISPQFDLSPDEESRQFWEADQNGSCWGEYEALGPLLEAVPEPKKVLEIGPGLGRSTVFFKKKLGWQGVKFHLYEGTGTKTKYTQLGPRFDDSFCGNLEWLGRCLRYNGIDNVDILDAVSYDGDLSRLPGPYDLIYGFYSIGFHWALEHFLDDLLTLMHEKTVALFTVPTAFEGLDELHSLCFRILKWRPVWPTDRELKMLVFSRAVLPEF